MDFSPVILAIPMYFTLMGIELAFEGYTKQKTYRLNDAVTNISTGTLQQLSGTFLVLFKIGLYTFVFTHFRIVDIPANTWSFIVLFFLWDFCYYWEHRMAHTISLFWGGHSVHHQSEDYNLSVALRQSSTSFFWGLPFYLPLAIMGFDPTQFVLAGGFNLLYQFWIHTEHIDRMPRWFEWFFNTPSHHRVHHGRDPKYIDKNFTGVFIIWDRMFGTFQEEEERPTYGVTTPLNSWNPVYANFAHYKYLYETVGQAKNWKDKLGILFNKPGWLPKEMGGYQAPHLPEKGYQKYNAQNSLRFNIYVLSQFLAAMGTNAYFFFTHAQFTDPLKVAYAVWIIWTMLMFGFFFERSGWKLVAVEVLRLLCLPFGFIWIQQLGLVSVSWVMPVIIVFVLGSLSFVLWSAKQEKVVPA